MPRVKSSRNSPSNSPAPQGRAGVVRIISGQWKGRKLPVRDVEGLRPTTDRVKETIFNWLAPHVRGTRCLDLFAGSGGLGLEALSRYAEQVTLIEMDRGAADQLKKNLTTLGSSQGQVIQADAVSWLQGTATPLRSGLSGPTVSSRAAAPGVRAARAARLAGIRCPHLSGTGKRDGRSGSARQLETTQGQAGWSGLLSALSAGHQE